MKKFSEFLKVGWNVYCRYVSSCVLGGLLGAALSIQTGEDLRALVSGGILAGCGVGYVWTAIRIKQGVIR